MTNRILVIVAALLAMGTAVADGPRHAGGPDIEQLTTLLELDAYQAQEVERIMTAHREAAKARRDEFRAAGERPDRETVQAHRQEMRASLQAELATVLSADQLAKLDALHEMRGKRPPRGHKRRPPADTVEEAG